MALIKFVLDPDNPPQLTPEQQARLDAMTEEEIEANAASDPDNPPPDEAEIARATLVRLARRVREKSGLSQRKFADTYRINVARLRDLEQGRSRPDSALAAYLKVIEREPEAVLRALQAE